MCDNHWTTPDGTHPAHAKEEQEALKYCEECGDVHVENIICYKKKKKYTCDKETLCCECCVELY